MIIATCDDRESNRCRSFECMYVCMYTLLNARPSLVTLMLEGLDGLNMIR